MANKLELTWVGKEERIEVEPRILIEVPDKSFSESADDLLTAATFDNMLIHGDNLLALKALESKFAGQVKCIYIDPPYNTGYAFEHYDDNLEHSQWLNLMRPRLEILRNLLSEDGSIWISIDDDEYAYLKVLCDEVFGRRNFISTICWQKKYGPANDAKWLSDTHDFILCYAKNKEIWHPNNFERTEKQLKDFKNPDNDPRGVWRASDLSARTYSASCDYPITGPTGNVFYPPPTRAWAVSKETFERLVQENRIWWGKNKDTRPMRKKFLTEVKDGITPETWWTRDFADDNKVAKYESKDLFKGKSFGTPKPEKLLMRVVTLASNPGDLVLDSFLGSGTTAAVAHKMGRRWIGIEMGDHAYTHCKVRLDKVIKGEDAGGITKAVKWTKGGGYKFYELAPTLIKLDAFGEPVINKEYDADRLAAAVALHEGFNYQPDAECFWKQSVGNEQSYLFVTTTHISAQHLDAIKNTMQDGEFLIIACKSFDQGIEKAYKEISIKKIPQMLLDRCKFGVADYNLNIINPPVYEDEEECNE